MYLNNQWVVVLGHTDGAAYGIDDLKATGCSVLFIGLSEATGARADRFIRFDLIKDRQRFLNDEIPALEILRPVAVVSWLENMKDLEFEVADRLGVARNSAYAYQASRDKRIFRLHLEKHGFETPKAVFVADLEPDPEPPLPFPFICKPNYGYASGGVRLVQDRTQFFEALRTIRRLNRFVFRNERPEVTGAMCEEYIDGPEFSVDSITADGLTRSFCICVRGFPAENDFSDYMYLTPPVGNDEILKRAEEILNPLLAGLSYRYGPTHGEFRICNRTGRLMLLEVGLRVGFVGNIGRLCQMTTGIAYNQLAWRAAMGVLTKEQLVATQPIFQRFGISLTPDTRPGGKIVGIEGLPFLKSCSDVANFYFTKQLGDFVIPYPKGLEYLGEILVISNTRERLTEVFNDVKTHFKFVFEPA